MTLHTGNVDADVGARGVLGGLGDGLGQHTPDVGAVLHDIQHQIGLRESHAAAHLQRHA